MDMRHPRSVVAQFVDPKPGEFWSIPRGEFPLVPEKVEEKR